MEVKNPHWKRKGLSVVDDFKGVLKLNSNLPIGVLKISPIPTAARALSLKKCFKLLDTP